MSLFNKKSELAIVFRNPRPRRESQFPNGWMLFHRGYQVRIYVSRDAARRPTIVAKEAA
jgi:hypothetical protein